MSLSIGMRPYRRALIFVLRYGNLWEFVWCRLLRCNRVLWEHLLDTLTHQVWGFLLCSRCCPRPHLQQTQMAVEGTEKIGMAEIEIRSTAIWLLCIKYLGFGFIGFRRRFKNQLNGSHRKKGTKAAEALFKINEWWWLPNWRPAILGRARENVSAIRGCRADGICCASNLCTCRTSLSECRILRSKGSRSERAYCATHSFARIWMCSVKLPLRGSNQWWSSTWTHLYEQTKLIKSCVFNFMGVVPLTAFQTRLRRVQDNQVKRVSNACQTRLRFG